MQSPFGAQQDTLFMHEALQEATCAFKQDEVPVGAVIVDKEGLVIARAHNQTEQQHTQLAHAEILTLKQACQAIGDWRLLGCWIYVTLQPCAMCMHAIRMHRVEGLVYAAHSPLFGYHLDKEGFDSLYKNDTILILPDVEAEKSEQLLKAFFKLKRG